MPTEKAKHASSSARRQSFSCPRRREGGAVAIMTPFVLVVMVAMCGMALDLGYIFNRKAELQNAADGIALAAAALLDGTTDGIDRALAEAEHMSTGYGYAFMQGNVGWSSSAVRFATSASAAPGDWMDSATAKTNASKVFFARVDTSDLNPGNGIVHNMFIPILSSSLATTKVSAVAVAGRDTMNVLPLAICANSNTAASALATGELVEFGFRRGVSYNLMNLNPGGRSPENFLVNPFAAPGTVGTTMSNRIDLVAPFVCTGTVDLPTLRGGEIAVERGFPLGSLYVHLNSRFGTYASPCVASTAPADPVVTSFDLNHVTWMKYTPDGLAAAPLAAPDPLLTVAEKPASATRTAYGPLWSYSHAVKYSSYAKNGGVEPFWGYDEFVHQDWSLLYNQGSPPVPQSYPYGTAPHSFFDSYWTPYLFAGGRPYRLHRSTRILHVPLLRCPVSPGTSVTASVIGIGKFFMTVPATPTAIYGEFAGTDTEAALAGRSRLYR